MDGSRTRTGQALDLMPLPVGPPRRPPGRSRTVNLSALNGAPLPVGLRGGAAWDGAESNRQTARSLGYSQLGPPPARPSRESHSTRTGTPCRPSATEAVGDTSGARSRARRYQLTAEDEGVEPLRLAPHHGFRDRLPTDGRHPPRRRGRDSNPHHPKVTALAGQRHHQFGHLSRSRQRDDEEDRALNRGAVTSTTVPETTGSPRERSRGLPVVGAARPDLEKRPGAPGPCCGARRRR